MLVLSAAPVGFAQIQDDGLSGADAHEDAPAQRKYLFGDWNGHRKQLLERGVDLDLQYVADNLWNTRSDKKARLASWNRVRGTVNLDLGKLAGAHDFYFHITGLWQAGSNIGMYLGTIAKPSGIASVNTFRLDSYWIEKRFLDQRLVARVGQFGGQDFYGTQHDAVSFVTEPLDYASGEEDKAAMIGNLALFGTYTVDGEGDFTGNLVQGCTFPNWIGDQRTAEQLKEVVDGDHLREVFQSGNVRVEIHWQRVIAP